MDRQKDIEAALAVLWEKHKESMYLRLAPMEKASAALSHGSLSDELRDEAKGEAHKLAGSLGTFGLHHGSRLAKEAEELLAAGAGQAGDAQRLSSIAAELRSEMDQKTTSR